MRLTDRILVQGLSYDSALGDYVVYVIVDDAGNEVRLTATEYARLAGGALAYFARHDPDLAAAIDRDRIDQADAADWTDDA